MSGGMYFVSGKGKTQHNGRCRQNGTEINVRGGGIAQIVFWGDRIPELPPRSKEYTHKFMYQCEYVFGTVGCCWFEGNLFSKAPPL